MARGQLYSGQHSGAASSEQEIRAALAAYGLEPSAPVDPDEEFYLWPGCLPILQLWCAVHTQWQYRPDGKRSGLSYQGVHASIELLGVAAADRAEFFLCIQAMERATLDELAT